MSPARIRIFNEKAALQMSVDTLTTVLSIAPPGSRPPTLSLHPGRNPGLPRDTAVLFDFRMDIKNLSVEVYNKMINADPLGYHITARSSYRFADSSVCSDSVLFAAVDSLNRNSGIEAEVLGSVVSGTASTVLYSIENYDDFIFSLSLWRLSARC